MASMQIEDGPSDPSDLSDLFAAGAKVKQELLRSCNGLMSAAGVAQLLSVTQQNVNKRRRAKKLLAIPLGNGFGYPALQFEGRRVVPGLSEILELLADRPWETLAFLVTPLEELAERTPLAVLTSKDVPAKELALRLARILASDDFG